VSRRGVRADHGDGEEGRYARAVSAAWRRLMGWHPVLTDVADARSQMCEGTDISYLLVHCTMTYYVYLSTVVRVCTHWS
jgi:hypothetical protein